MELKILSKPNTLNEAALLIGKAISHTKGEKIKLSLCSFIFTPNIFIKC